MSHKTAFKLSGSFLWAVLLLFVVLGSASGQSYRCLPKGFTNNSIASSTTMIGDRTITVTTALSGLKARCKRGRLVDRHGRAIRLYQKQGCWGNPPADYEEILARQDKQIRKLRKRYTVVEIKCDSGEMPRRLIP